MGNPSTKMKLGKYKGYLIKDIPTQYLLWFVSQETTCGYKAGKIHTRAGIILELEKRGISSPSNEINDRALYIVNKYKNSCMS